MRSYRARVVRRLRPRVPLDLTTGRVVATAPRGADPHLCYAATQFRSDNDADAEQEWGAPPLRPNEALVLYGTAPKDDETPYWSVVACIQRDVGSGALLAPVSDPSNKFALSTPVSPTDPPKKVAYIAARSRLAFEYVGRRLHRHGYRVFECAVPEGLASSLDGVALMLQWAAPRPSERAVRERFATVRYGLRGADTQASISAWPYRLGLRPADEGGCVWRRAPGDVRRADEWARCVRPLEDLTAQVLGADAQVIGARRFVPSLAAVERLASRDAAWTTPPPARDVCQSELDDVAVSEGVHFVVVGVNHVVTGNATLATLALMYEQEGTLVARSAFASEPASAAAASEEASEFFVLAVMPERRDNADDDAAPYRRRCQSAQVPLAVLRLPPTVETLHCVSRAYAQLPGARAPRSGTLLEPVLYTVRDAPKKKAHGDGRPLHGADPRAADVAAARAGADAGQAAPAGPRRAGAAVGGTAPAD